MPAAHREPRPDPSCSARMARIRGKNTQPELIVRRVAHALGFRFRIHRSDLPGSPDLVFSRHNKVIQVHGCFWHRHRNCSRSSTPKTRTEYWLKRFEANIHRDKCTEAELKRLGWDVLVIWECETKDLPCLQDALTRYLQPGGRS
jgi:DNA mismatch endonuclease (patch repair protein)